MPFGQAGARFHGRGALRLGPELVEAVVVPEIEATANQTSVVILAALAELRRSRERLFELCQ